MNLLHHGNINIFSVHDSHCMFFIYIGVAKRGLTKFHATDKLIGDVYLQSRVENSLGSDF